ncbi:MAG: hypothetical protein KatS3mg070_0213 [Meiothermus sp.]|nr:MAG: hypothetical protein KatS3mg070_0213 [Meiothermus sp.]
MRASQFVLYVTKYELAGKATMDQGVAESIAAVATVVLWLYSLNGLLVGWIAKYYRDGLKPSFPLVGKPKWSDLLMLVAVWSLSSMTLATLTALSGELKTPVPGVRLAAEELSAQMLFGVALEEIERMGIYELFRGTFWAAVWLNSAWFGFTHLASYADLMAQFPGFVLMMPFGTAAFGLASLAITLRVGLFWAIGVHFLVNSFPLVVIHELIVVNYLIFIFSTAGLFTIGIINLRR